VPTPQLVHTVDAVAVAPVAVENVPAAQLAQAVAPVPDWYWPATHPPQLSAPVAACMKPTAHDVHAVISSAATAAE
jgi:hypothetical protein